jgi:hypothetical protein
MGARNQVGIGLLYRSASLCSLATQFQTRFLESIPRPIAGIKFSTQSFLDVWRTLHKISINAMLKGSLTRDFRFQAFLKNQFPPGPWVSQGDHFDILRKFTEIFYVKVDHLKTKFSCQTSFKIYVGKLCPGLHSTLIWDVLKGEKI